MSKIVIEIELDDHRVGLAPRVSFVTVNGKTEPGKHFGPHFSYWQILIDEDQEYSLELKEEK